MSYGYIYISHSRDRRWYSKLSHTELTIIDNINSGSVVIPGFSRSRAKRGKSPIRSYRRQIRVRTAVVARRARRVGARRGGRPPALVAMAPVDTALRLYWAMVAVFTAALVYTVFNFPAPEFSPAPVIKCKPWSPLRPRCDEGCNVEFALQLPALRCVPARRQEKKKISGGGGLRKAEGLVSGSARSAANCLAAADIFEAAAEAESGKAAADLLLKAADALTCAMRINGDGNLVLIDGVLDTPSNKQVCGKPSLARQGLSCHTRCSSWVCRVLRFSLERCTYVLLHQRL
eukprot:6209292-Pleurochrysis_carterae.AAC.1